MFFGVLLIITWLILLLRYPAKALPVSLAAAVGLGFVAIWVVWLDNREASQLARLELRISYAPQECPADRPLKLNCAGASPPMHRATRSTWPTTSMPPHAIAALANCKPAAPGTIACQPHLYAPATARKPWSSVPSTCKAVSRTDEGSIHAQRTDHRLLQRHRPCPG
jgi:hypothetical protein